MQNIPMVDLRARHARMGVQVEAAVLRALRSGRWIGGPEVTRCEAEVAAIFGRRHGVGVNSGTDALTLALRALGVGRGDEVLVPALSFFATLEAVLLLGAQPVVVDVLPDIPVMDPAAARVAAGPRTRAVIAVHLFGMSCPDPGLDLPMVEDSAQAIGLSPPPRLGQLTAASFYPTKTLGCPGDGGLVATDDEELADRLRRLASHGGVPGQPHTHELVGGHPGTNSRLDAVHAAAILAQLPDLPRRVARRRALATSYDASLPPGVRPVPRLAGDPIHQYVLRSAHRDRLATWLGAQGIETAVYYPRPLSRQPAAEAGGHDTPVAEGWCREILSIPCHEELTDSQTQRIRTALESFPP